LGAKDEPNIRAYEPGDVDFDILVIDSPPRIDERPFLQAFDEADLVIIPSRPGPVDLLALAKSLPFLQARNPRKKMALLFNGAQVNRVLSRTFETNVRDVGIELPILQTAIHEYECYRRVFVDGWKSLSDAGRLEAPMLANEIFALLK
jgi:cellulose biosynthesis protein BcsQ